MDKVRTIRAAYMCIGLVALAVACPELALWSWPVVPMFFFPNCVCCGTGVCIVCTSSASAEQYQIDISGVGNGTCADCDTFNGTWVVTRGASRCGVANGCNWDYITPDMCGGENTCIAMVINSNGLGTYFIIVTGGISGFAPGIQYQDTSMSQPTCSTFSAKNIAFSSNGPNCANTSTCSVTAL